MQSLYHDDAKIVVKIYSMMIYTHKMKTFKKTDFDQYRHIIKTFNAKFESMHVTSLQKKKQKNFFFDNDFSYEEEGE